MNKKSLVLLPAVLLMAACGGTYQVSSSNPAKGTPESFASDEIECNNTNAFVASSTSSSQKIYMTQSYLECMKSKGWNFNKTGTKFSFVKSAD